MKRFLMICCAALLAACGTIHWPTAGSDDYWIKAGAARPASRVESLLAYAGYARSLSAAESARENESLRLAFAAQDRTDFVRLRYALLLVVSASPGRDLPLARQLLEPMLEEDGHDAALRRLAAYLHAGIGDLLAAERHRIDAERRRLDGERHQFDAERRYREEQRRANDLDQKLEALKSIEQRIIQRTAPEKRR